MNLTLYTLLPVLATVTPGSFADILQNATSVFTWFITSMGRCLNLRNHQKIQNQTNR